MSALQQEKRAAVTAAEVVLRKAKCDLEEGTGDEAAVKTARLSHERAKIALKEVIYQEQQAAAESAEHTDFDLIMCLEEMLGYNTSTGNCYLTIVPGVGLSLEESDSPDAKPSVREAIIDYIVNNP